MDVAEAPCVFILPHLLCRVDLDALVELILKHRHHGVIPWNPVDSGVFQTHLLHQAAADLHNQWDELGEDGITNLTLSKKKRKKIKAFSYRGRILLLTLLITPGWQSSNLTPKALGPDFWISSWCWCPRRLWRAALIWGQIQQKTLTQSLSIKVYEVLMKKALMKIGCTTLWSSAIQKDTLLNGLIITAVGSLISMEYLT